MRCKNNIGILDEFINRKLLYEFILVPP